MAKTKKRRKKQAHPSGGIGAASRPDATTARAAADTGHGSTRGLKKELARRERERQLRAFRRRLLVRRALRWGIAVVVPAAVITFFVVRNAQEAERAAIAAESAGCTDISTEPDVLSRHTPPFAEGTGGVPASVGNHSAPLPPEPHVYDEPVAEENIIHNLEHGYVVIYHRADGDGSLDPAIVSDLEAIANSEDKVLMVPYEGLANELTLVAWRHVQRCDPSASAADQAQTVVEHFIDEFRGGGLAPEPAAP